MANRMNNLDDQTDYNNIDDHMEVWA